ncbi:MAG TPA: hypothetical protein VFA67_11925 [Candidatus Sulfotelmatobacter sp.]|nr:hypothetical protein [Candidatus Sulfotelmatobacter sp.]
MRLLRYLGFLVCICTLAAVAADNNLGIKDVNRVRFEKPVRIGTESLPAGDYVVRHTMVGEEHLMLFQRQNSNAEFKVKCTLVPLANKAEQSQTVYETAGNERIVQELVFRGDKAKHVFQK